MVSIPLKAIVPFVCGRCQQERALGLGNMILLDFLGKQGRMLIRKMEELA
jgi:hypothetical protein